MGSAVMLILAHLVFLEQEETILERGWSLVGHPDRVWHRTGGHAVVATLQPQCSCSLKQLLYRSFYWKWQHYLQTKTSCRIEEDLKLAI